MKNRIIIILLFGVMSLHASQVYQASESLPLEFQYLVETVQLPPAKPIKQQIESIDSYLDQIPLKQISFLLKTEIIKFFLEHPPAKLDKNDLKLEILTRGADKLEANKNKLSSLSVWLIASIQSDLNQLLNSPHFPEIARAVIHGRPGKQPNLLKQIRILLPIYAHFIKAPLEEFKLHQKGVVTQLFAHIENYLRYYASLHQGKKKRRYQLVFFKKAEAKNLLDHARIMAILGNVKLPTGKKASGDSWVPKDSLLLFPTPDPNYIPPTNLPRPVGNWKNEIGQLFPTQRDDYVPPSTLPLPVRDWIEKVPPTPTPVIDPDADWILE